MRQKKKPLVYVSNSTFFRIANIKHYNGCLPFLARSRICIVSAFNQVKVLR